MTIAISCDNCGKTYNASNANIGKRVKCKACGQVFTIAAAPSAQSVNPPIVVTPVPAAGFDIPEVLARFYPNRWVVLASLVAALAIGPFANQFPSIWHWALIGFPVLAVLFLIVGLTVIIAEARRTPGSFKVAWRDLSSAVLPVLFTLLLGLLLGLVVIRYRKRALSRIEFGAFYERVAWLMVSSGAVALMSLVVLAAGFTVDRMQPQGRGSPGFERRLNNAYRVESEKHLRRLASGVFTYRANAHKNPATLADLFRGDSTVLDSPFSSGKPDSYVYLPGNITGQKDGNIVLYDRAELEATGYTQAITNGFEILILSRDDLSARSDIPH